MVVEKILGLKVFYFVVSCILLHFHMNEIEDKFVLVKYMFVFVNKVEKIYFLFDDLCCHKIFWEISSSVLLPVDGFFSFNFNGIYDNYY